MDWKMIRKQKNIKIQKTEKKKVRISIQKFNFKLIVSYLGISVLLFLFAFSIISAYTSLSKRKFEKMKNSLFPQIKIEIYNASGYEGIARKLAWYLRDNKFDVVYYGNANDMLEKTVIVDRIDSSMKYAKILREFLGNGIIGYEPDPDKLTTITILIGKDIYKILSKIKNYDKIF
jgi:hypothetical protein